METDIRAKIINDIILEYCSAEYKNRYECIKQEIDNSELYLLFNENFDKDLCKYEQERMDCNRGYFL